MKTPRSIRGSQSYGIVDSPAGPISFATDEDAVTGIWLGKRRKADPRLQGLARETRNQLRAYLKGDNHAFDLPLAFDLPAFTARVLAEVESIAWGESRSYGEIALLVGSPGAARAVGQAMGANPLPIVIPCHRVVAASNRLGGFGGGLKWKRWLLDHEGVEYRA
ncbi:MAG: methylated-DNA--[protein]-cysteine S-methyltransferase [Planctomycetota bacterium]